MVLTRVSRALRLALAGVALGSSAFTGSSAFGASLNDAAAPLASSDLALPMATSEEDHDHSSGYFSVSAPLAAATAPAAAGTVATRETELDAIYGQASVLKMLGERIDIRFNDAVLIEAPTLTKVSSIDQLDQLFGLTDPLFKDGDVLNRTVSLYYLDDIDYCGGYSKSYVGCGTVRGNQVAVEKRYAANDGYGAELIAHELGHALGLSHSNDTPISLGSTPNLMSPGLNKNTTLVDAQVAQIMALAPFQRMIASPLVQRDALGLYVSITPYVVVDKIVVTDPFPDGGVPSRVPLPGAGPLLAAAALLLCAMRRRAAA